MMRLLRMRRLIRLLSEFTTNEKGREAVYWYSTEHKNYSAFVDYMITETYFGLGLFARLWRLVRLPLTSGMRDKKKRHITQAIQKAMRKHTKDGYAESFQYIVHPNKWDYDWKDIATGSAFATGKQPEKKPVLDDNYLQVTPEGIEFLTPTWFLHDVWQECNRAFVIIGGFLFGGVSIAFYKVIANAVCSVDKIKAVCAIFGL